MSTITIDDKQYEVDKMSDEEKSLVQAMNYCDAKIAETQNQLAALKTARQAYVNDLGSRLKK